jgi:hypothetical protein
MPITPYLGGQYFDPETKRIMGVAFEMALAALRLKDRTDPIVAIIANRIIEAAKEGVLDPHQLCERALGETGSGQI